MDQELADIVAYVLGRCCVCTHQMAALLRFYAWNDIMDASWT